MHIQMVSRLFSTTQVSQQYEFKVSPSGNDSVLPDKVRTIVQRGLTAMANQRLL